MRSLICTFFFIAFSGYCTSAPNEIDPQQGTICISLFIDKIENLKQNLNILFKTGSDIASENLSDYWSINLIQTKIYQLSSTCLMWKHPNESSTLLKSKGNLVYNSTWMGEIKGDFIHLKDKNDEGFSFTYKSGILYTMQVPMREKIKFKYVNHKLCILENEKNASILKFAYTNDKGISRLTQIITEKLKVKLYYNEFQVYSAIYDNTVHKILLSKIEISDGRTITIDYTIDESFATNQMVLTYYYFDNCVLSESYHWGKDGTPTKINDTRYIVKRLPNNKKNEASPPYKDLNIEYFKESEPSLKNLWRYDFEKALEEDYSAASNIKILTTYRKMCGYNPVLKRKIELFENNLLRCSKYFIYDENGVIIRSFLESISSH